MAHLAARSLTATVLALTALACAPSASRDQPGGLGRQILAGPARAAVASPDGTLLAVLDGCQEVRAQFLPPQTARCDLRVVAASGGDATKVAAGVTTLPQGVDWSPDGQVLVAMADYDHAAAAATLVRWSPGAAARALAARVTFHGFGPRGELGFVAGGRLSVMLPGDGAPREVPGGDGIASFDLSPREFPPCGARATPALRLVARRAQAAGGQLLSSGCALDRLQILEAGQVGDYGFARGAPALAYTVIRREGTALRLVDAERGAAVELGRGAQAFAFGPDGRTVAFVADLAPGKQGNLHLGGAARKDTVLAREVGEFRWATAAARLAWLERYDPRVRAGILGAGGPDLAPRTVAQNVTDLELSRDGERLAFLQHTTRGGYSVDLGLATLGATQEKPVTVAQGVFGFGFSPDGKWLYYRTRCVRNGEACDLERVPAAGLAAGAKPEVVAPGVKSFEFDPRDPERLLVTWQRADLVALDVGVWSRGTLVKVDRGILPGSARFLGPDSRRLSYVVVQPKRQGVYVAELPK